jgi:thioredoxin 1
MLASSSRLVASAVSRRLLPGAINHGYHSTVNGRHRFMSSVITLSDLEATEKFRALNGKSILYFTATWCPPCKAIKPVYEEMATKYPSVAFGKVDVDDNSDAALEFEIKAVPTFVLFDGEDPVERFSGADPKKLESLVKTLDER